MILLSEREDPNPVSPDETRVRVTPALRFIRNSVLRSNEEDIRVSHETYGVERRTVLQMIAGLAAGTQLGLVSAKAEAAKPAATGKPGDFDFLSGNWKIKNRFLKGTTWETFDGEATVYGILSGVASIEELRIPARNFFGMGLRLLDVERKLWADSFVNARSGVLAPSPAWGSFVNGVGTWDSDDTDGDKPIIVRGVWDQITPKSCRWYQASSRDDGKSWAESWVMQWTRV